MLSFFTIIITTNTIIMRPWCWYVLQSFGLRSMRLYSRARSPRLPPNHRSVPWLPAADTSHPASHIKQQDSCSCCMLTDWVVVLRPTRHKTSHFGDVYPSQSLGLVWKKTTLKPNTTKALIHQSKEMYYNTKQTQKTKARFSSLLRHPAWKGNRSILIGKR